MGLALNAIIQTIVWYGFMAAIIFGAAGTTDYTGGWLYLGVMIAISIVFGAHMMHADPDLLRERLKPPVQKGQPLADRLVVIPILLLIFGRKGIHLEDGIGDHHCAEAGRRLVRRQGEIAEEALGTGRDASLGDSGVAGER